MEKFSARKLYIQSPNFKINTLLTIVTSSNGCEDTRTGMTGGIGMIGS